MFTAFHLVSTPASAQDSNSTMARRCASLSARSKRYLGQAFAFRSRRSIFLRCVPGVPAACDQYHALHDLAQLQPGERVLVLGASGGVGMAAIDLAVAAGCEVVACASSAAKLQVCKEAGASVLINYETDAGGDFKEALRLAGVYPLIDVVVDPVGGKWSETGLRSLRWGGRLVIVGFAAGGTAPKDGIAKVPLNLALLNERKILGCGVGTWQGQPMAKLMEQVAAGQLRPFVKEYPLKDYASAFSDIMGRRVVGKIVLRVSDGPKL